MRIVEHGKTPTVVAVILAISAGGLLAACSGWRPERAEGTAASRNGTAGMMWVSFPDPWLEVRGLPWFSENAPDLFRLPKSAQGKAPKNVWARALAPDGGRIRFSSTTSRLAIRAQAVSQGARVVIDAYVNGRLAGSADATSTQTAPLVLFQGGDRARKDITLYLPNRNQARVLAVGVDADAPLGAPSPFALPRPLVCYGSSVLQGSGVSHPAMTYPAIVARRLNLDLVNLGFGGAGKAEPEVVALVNQIDACCYLFDLGKSYGIQPLEVYGRMLDTIRASHPDTPIIVVTPIYSTKEPVDAAYHEKSELLRDLMRKAATDRAKAGDQRMFVVEGLDLCGERDKDYFHDSTHPNDEGNQRMADRLAPVVQRIVLGKDGGGGRQRTSP
ncbi:MAG: GDSL-type esterase/lipase family protein [Candidatus Sumerlaeota bacterium]|nr:GDSL-type esterase/lipase family protein [Candidatus Sumerlaeota bacterium]